MRWNTRQYFDKIVGKVGRIEGEFFLDVGCGTGRLTRRVGLSGLYCIGVDIKRDDEWRRSRGPNCHFLVCDARFLPFSRKAFSIVFCKDVLHHTNEPRRVISELIAAATQRVVLFESNRYNPLLLVHMTMILGHAHFSARRFKSLVRSVAGDAAFSTAEIHLLPESPRFLAKIMKFLQEFVEARKILSQFHACNIAMINLPITHPIRPV